MGRYKELLQAAKLIDLALAFYLYNCRIFMLILHGMLYIVYH